MKPASRGNRLIGQFIDGLIGGAPIFASLILMSMSTVAGGLLLLAGLAWSLFYVLFADGLHDGQSYGKRFLEMRVVDEQTGEPCGFGKSFVRNVVLIILGPIDWIFIFGERRQRLGDRLAGTIVIAAD
jgi:uncharacterized RDD family membrane protein YckC